MGGSWEAEMTLLTYRCPNLCSATFTKDGFDHKLFPTCPVCRDVMEFMGHADQKNLERLVDVVAAGANQPCSHCGGEVMKHGKKLCKDCHLLHQSLGEAEK